MVILFLDANVFNLNYLHKLFLEFFVCLYSVSCLQNGHFIEKCMFSPLFSFEKCNFYRRNFIEKCNIPCYTEKLANI